MSLQELKSFIISRVERVEDAKSLELLAALADEVLPEEVGSVGLSDAELAAALRGRQEIAEGQSGSLDEMRKRVLATIERVGQK